jgi:hypothetical protein
VSERWLQERTEETRALLRERKRELALELTAGGEGPNAGELLAIDRLEAKLANRERIARVREQTRVRANPGP